jgi:CubicO group peptidase (beta-lactamase class C family)
MNMPKLSFPAACLFLFCFLFCQQLSAHNGKVAHAYPVGVIKVDGNLSDWPKTALPYRIATAISESKPVNSADFSGFFQVGYRPDNHSLYVAFTITDNDFIEDTSNNVAWNTQDGLELNLDARHLPFGSGVCSFMYSKKLRNINTAFYDPFSQKASWDIAEVGFVRKGNTRYYEWRIQLGDELVVGKSIGFDVMLFDKDKDGSFTFTGWGKGESKYRSPGSLGDIILLPANEKLATVSGTVAWDRPMKEQLPGQVRLQPSGNQAGWLSAEVDSLGRYAVAVPAGSYEVLVPDAFIVGQNNIYATAAKTPVIVTVKAGLPIKAPALRVAGAAAPDLLPEKGILHQPFTAERAAQVDQFIESYQRYLRIPGVSLALIKDGQVVYHKTYGVKNTFTGGKVDSLTLFEAASVTKPVFAFAVQRLAERGVIDLDKPLYLYLPYKDIEYDERYKLMTARHVLTHRTGFPNWRSNNPDGKLNLRFTPGTAYNYSGEGFEYLKMVVEKITGKNVEQVLQEEVIAPIGLYHTFFSKNDSLMRMVANGHYDMMPSSDPPPAYPGMAYSMHTEALVFTRFMLYLLEQQGLNAQSYNTMLQKHSDYNYDPGDEKPKVPTYMSMSLEIRETPLGKSFGHGGNNGDFKCRFEVYKDLKMGYVIFTNSNTSDPLLHVFSQFLVEGKE